MADGTRTHDNRNHNPGLYQLSYSHHSIATLGPPWFARGSILACPTGLEPITPSLEGWCSIRLSYGQGRRDPDTARGTDPAKLVGVRGFEPPTSCSQSRHATRLRHTPEARYYNCYRANGSICRDAPVGAPCASETARRWVRMLLAGAVVFCY